MSPETILLAIEVAATVAFALSGILEATRRRMDIVGVFSVAFASAFGGGTLRDLLLDRRPLFWVQNPEYIWLVLAMALAAPLLLRAVRHQRVDRVMEAADALGLGLFAISGASLAMVAGMPAVVSVLMGAITAVCGGVLRDVLCNEIPRVFHDHVPYTLCAFIGAALFLALHAQGVAPTVSTGAGIAVTSGLRLLAVARGWRIPAWPGERDGRG
ncbi:MAG TPA: trimeric intracellular cation channel family protein [Usitatibacteraceae bacterium]|nr:trimeric intracellular cation channel family protein [Usitatibacteraceae bacterium]